MDGFHSKAAQRDLLAGADLMEDGAGRQTMLLQLVFDQADGQLGGVDRHIEFFEQVRQTADVILMAVGDEQTLDAVLIFQHIGKIRNDQINAEHISIGENKSAVHEDHIPLAFIQRNVFADLTEAAQRADVHGGGRGHLIGLRCALRAAAAALGARGGILPGGSVLAALARAAGPRSRDALHGGLLCGGGGCRARLAGARLMLRGGSGILALRLGCAGTALLRRTAGILSGLNRLGVIFAFWLKLFHRKPPNHRISGLIPACCSYRTPCQTVAIYVFFRAITLLCL